MARRSGFKKRWYRRLPVGTPVLVVQRLGDQPRAVEAETAGVIESWEDEPTGSWFAHGDLGRLWLSRLRLRKVDGEQTVLVNDDRTKVYPPEWTPPLKGNAKS